MKSRLAATGFGSSASELVWIDFRSDHFRIRRSDGWRSFTYDHITQIEEGVEPTQWLVQVADELYTGTLYVQSAALHHFLQTRAPERIRLLAQSRIAIALPALERLWLTYRHGILAAGVLALVALPLAYNALTTWVTYRVPVSWERHIGESTFKGMVAKHKAFESPRAQEAVAIILKRLTEGQTAYPFEVKVIQDPTINAWAAPGGFIGIHVGLIAFCETPEELAGVLAHEVQHVLLRHTLRGVIHQSAINVFFALMTGGNQDSIGQWIQTIETDIASSSFSRYQESEADRTGAELLLQKQIAPAGMSQFFERLSKTRPDQPSALAAYFSTHPVDAKRSERLKQIASLGTKSTPTWPFDWNAIRAEAIQFVKKKEKAS